MDKFLDFFRDIKDRLSNPMFSSFIIAWLFFNWEVPVGLIFYNNETLKLDGYNSYIDLIKTNYSSANYFMKPIVVALVYTFIFPFVRNGVLAFQAWIKTWGNTINLRIARKGKISTERYMVLREAYLSQTKNLEKLIAEETSFVQENTRITSENTQLIGEKNELTKLLNLWQQMNDTRILQGEYEYTFQTSIAESKKTYRLVIESSRLFLYNDISKQDLVEEYSIQDFYCNHSSKSMCFVLWPVKGKTKTIFHLLKFPNGLNEFYGKEDNLYSVTYRKVNEEE